MGLSRQIANSLKNEATEWTRTGVCLDHSSGIRLVIDGGRRDLRVWIGKRMEVWLWRRRLVWRAVKHWLLFDQQSAGKIKKLEGEIECLEKEVGRRGERCQEWQSADLASINDIYSRVRALEGKAKPKSKKKKK